MSQFTASEFVRNISFSHILSFPSEFNNANFEVGIESRYLGIHSCLPVDKGRQGIYIWLAWACLGDRICIAYSLSLGRCKRPQTNERGCHTDAETYENASMLHPFTSSTSYFCPYSTYFTVCSSNSNISYHILNSLVFNWNPTQALELHTISITG